MAVPIVMLLLLISIANDRDRVSTVRDIFNPILASRIPPIVGIADRLCLFIHEPDCQTQDGVDGRAVVGNG